VWIARRAEVAAGGKFLSRGLAKNNGACFEGSGDDRSIFLWKMLLVDGRVIACHKICGVDDIFDANRYAVQKTTERRLIELSRTCQCCVDV
jgi:hypothetical protein